MKISQIYNLLNQESPFELQEKWDNSGLNIGSHNDDIDSITLSLDIDTDVIESISSDTLLITHHPLIFSPIKQIDDSFPSILIKKMIQKNISLISMHTNFDKTHLNTYVLENILGFTQASRDGFISYADINMTFNELVNKVQKSLKLKYKKTTPTKEKISTIAITTGAGASLIKEVKADCFLTGDIKYHDAMMARELGLSLIDIGHFESEIFFAEIIKNILDKHNIKSTIINSSSPFLYQ